MYARIGFRRHRRRLLMMAVDHLEPCVVPERVVEMHGAAADDGEDMLDALFDEKIRDIV